MFYTHFLKLFVLLSAVSWLSVISAADENLFQLSEITPGIYLHPGTHAGFNEPKQDDIANIGFITGKNCVAVIDSGGSARTGNALLEAIHSITDKPVCYVINTHIHYDHILGNLAFANNKTEFIGHVNLPDAVESNRDFFLEQFRDNLGEAPSRESIIAPGKTVTDIMSIDLGGRILTLTAHKKAHTHTDLTVFDQNTKTIWTGDLVFRERIPVIDGSLKGWLEVMQILKKQEVNLIIPGHGLPGKTWAEIMAPQESYFNRILTETRNAIKTGLFMEEAIESIASENKENWLLFDQQHKANVSRAFIELEWE